MKAVVQSSGNCAGILGALIVVCLGVVLLMVFWPLGLLVMLLGLFMGGKREKVWRCIECRSIVRRG